MNEQRIDCGLRCRCATQPQIIQDAGFPAFPKNPLGFGLAFSSTGGMFALPCNGYCAARSKDVWGEPWRLEGAAEWLRSEEGGEFPGIGLI